MVSLTKDKVSAEFHETFLIRGYRAPNSTLLTCLKSIFTFDNNETLNFWTHFVPFLYLSYEIYKLNSDYDLLDDNFIWPFLIFLSTAAFYLLMSALAHALNCMSSMARHVCFILDYLSISMYGMGCCIGYKSYCLIRVPLFLEELSRYYVTLAMIIMFACNTISCASRFVISRKKRLSMRIVSFSLQYAFVSLPLFYRLLTKSSVLTSESDKYFILQLACALLSALIYMSHIPERYFPGLFDIIGHSHQLFHLSTASCTYFQMKGLYHELQLIKPVVYQNSLMLHMHFVHAKYYYAFVILICLLVNTLILFYYYFKALYSNPWNKLNSKNLTSTLDTSIPSTCDFCDSINKKSKKEK